MEDPRRGGLEHVVVVSSSCSSDVTLTLGFRGDSGPSWDRIVEALTGAVLFSVIAHWIRRRDLDPPCDELEKLNAALREDRVLVCEIAADAAIVICQRGDENVVLGDVLRVSDERVVYVS